MTSNLLVLIGIAVFFAVVIWSFWYDWISTRAQPPVGEMVETAHGRVHAIRRGQHPGEEGPRPIIMIHGSTTNALDMDLEMAGRLEAGREVFIPDRLGHGFSDRPDNGWRLDVQAAAIHEAARKAGIERPIVLGQSYGGAVALRYALDYPDEVAGLVLVAPVSHRWPGGIAWYNRVGVNPVYGWLFRRTFIALYGRFGSTKGVSKALRGSGLAATYHARTRVHLTFRPNEFHHNAEDIVRLYEQLVAMDARYCEIEAPTEVIAGTHDMTVITSVHGRRLSQQMQHASLTIVEDGGHALHHTHTEDTVAAIHRLDERLASGNRSPLQGALRRLTSVFPKSA